MKLESFREWIREIYATRDDELDCDAVFELIPRYVDMEARGDDPDLHYSEVAHHLQQCSYCRDIYVGVLEAAELEKEEPAERTPTLSARP